MIALQKEKINFTKTITYLLIAYAFALPLSKAALSLLEVLILLFWIFEGNWKAKYTKIKENLFLLSLSFFLLYSIIALLWSDNLSYGVNYIVRYRHFFIAYVIYTSFDTKYLKHIFSAFLIAMFLSEIMSYGIFFELWHYKNISPANPVPFMSHINYSSFLTFTIAILLTYLFYEKNDFKVNLFYIFFFLSATVNLFINGGRTGQVALILVFLVIFIKKFKLTLKTILLTFFSLIIIFSTAYIFSPNFQTRAYAFYDNIDKVVQENNYDSSIGLRLAFLQIGILHFYDNVWFGEGIGDERSHLEEYKQRVNIETSVDLSKYSYHNVFLNIATQFGIFGLISVIIMFYSLIKLRFNSPKYYTLNLSFVTLFFILSISHGAFHGMHPMIFFAIFTGLFNLISYQSTSNENR